MKPFTSFIIVLLMFAAVFAIVFGSYFPLRKAQLYIDMNRSFANIHSVQDLETALDKVFNYYSPVGTEEVTKFSASTLGSIVQDKQQPEAVSRAVVNYIEPHLFKNDVRHLITAATFHVQLLTNFRKLDDYTAAEGDYMKAFAIGPKLPPVLYGLLSLYDLVGQRQGELEVAQTIIKYWPDDQKVQNLVAALTGSAGK